MDIDTGAGIGATRRRPGPSGHSRTSPRRRLRAVLAVGAVATAATTAGALVMAGPASAASTLRSAAEASGHYFGTALTQSNLSNSTLTGVASAQFDMVTPGNEMKWDTTEPSNGSYNFGPGDQIVAWAKANNDRVRGHNLVWHSQLPSWVSSLPLNQVQAAMEAHITTEATHYKGQVYSWDVVNEPFNDDGTPRQDVFYNAFGGVGYIADAIKTAHAADPNAKLYINDYNIEGSGAKSNAMYSLAQSLLSAGVPLNGIGFESHFILGQIPSDMQSNMQRFASLGLDVAVTELDDRIQLPASTANLQQQATDFSNVVKDCLGVSRCVGVTQWGVGDADSWIPGFFSGYGAATMFDNNYQPKPSFNAALAALGGGATTPPSSNPPSTTPPSSAPPSTTPPSTTPPGGCHVADVINAWNTGLTSNLTITNNGSTAINGWKLAFTLPSGQSITSVWNATVTPSSGVVTATNLSYNATITANGGTTTLGFNANQTGNAGAPTSFTLNGTACSVS
ncbi:MAG TPA: endo-1,4-beta-xylanase [Actinocrinis sp.]|uniref:endo-1,4-beta-xylanase n=1 Tax=Actinocrinis sp. TaxID=1920516 RepID=UPI002DDDA760|nr:endo-1,4-beta-xylanase [Actinocrinis sp.]HEV2344469.1 endo-1,4-beta-xylanase [Actinocrinis sp.]